MSDNLNEPHKIQPVKPPLPVISAVDGSRRRFTGAGLAATGVVMSLASRPVLGCTSSESALSPSGWSSINASRCKDTSVSLGLSHGFWKNHTSAWPSSVPVTTLYRDVFPVCTAPFNDTSVNFTLLEALEGKLMKSPFGREIASAYLNAVSGKTFPYLKPEQVKQMATGSFTPATGGAPWNQDTILKYLALTYK